MKNAGKACNNRLYRHIRTFEKIIKNYFVILSTLVRYFNPRPPRGGRLVGRDTFFSDDEISIHAPREGGDTSGEEIDITFGISIHAPREGGDRRTIRLTLPPFGCQSTPPARGATRRRPSCGAYAVISIHAPREGGDFRILRNSTTRTQFQSTPPARGATKSSLASDRAFEYFNPRPPRGGRRYLRRVEARLYGFQSTPPARGATAKMHSFTCGSLTNK